MKWLGRGLVGVFALLALVLAGLAWWVPRYVRSDEVRAELREAARGAIGRELTYDDLRVSLFPPALVVEGVGIAGADPDAPPMLSCRRLALLAAFAPLLSGRLVLDEVEIDEPQVHVLRTADGFALPTQPASKRDVPPDETRGEADGEDFDIAIRSVRMKRGTLLWDDRSVSPPVSLELRELRAELDGTSLFEPFSIDLGVDGSGGGRITLSGTVEIDGDLDLNAQLADLDLSVVHSYFDFAAGWSGIASGEVRIGGPAASPSEIDGRLVIEKAEMSFDQVDLSGRLSVSARLSEVGKATTGSFEIDATEAKLDLGGAFTKPVGVRKTVTGRIVTRDDGRVAIDDVALSIKNLEGRGAVVFGKRTSVVFSAPPTDLDGWEELIPALRGLDLAGSVHMDEVAVLTSPLEIRGRVWFEGGSARVAAVRLRGGVVADGAEVRTEALEILTADQVIAVEMSARLFERPVHYTASAVGRKLETNLLVTALAEREGFVQGPIDLETSVEGTLGGEKPFVDAIKGSLRFDWVDVRIRDVSFLKLTVDAIGGLPIIGTPAAATRWLFGGADTSRLYDDRFRRISGSFALADGRATTADTHIVHRAYTVDAWGDVTLADGGLDMHMQVIPGEQLLAMLPGPWTRAFGRALPGAQVGGTLTAPTASISGEAGEEVVAGLGATGKALGKGAGAGASLLGRGGQALGGGGRAVGRGVRGLGLRRGESGSAPPESSEAGAEGSSATASP